MTFALKLFKINLLHTYYTKGICNDFTFVPDEATKQWMARYHMELRESQGIFEVVWRMGILTDPLKFFKQKMADKKFSFLLHLKNPQLVNFSALTMNTKSHTTYYFHNLLHPEKLHAKEYISDADKLAIQKLAHYPHKPGKNIFGLIDIYLEKLWKEHDFVIENLPITYTLNFKAREVIWQYRVLDVNHPIRDAMKIVLGKEDHYFNTTVAVNPEGGNMRVFESKKAMPLVDKAKKNFSLKSYKQEAYSSSGKTLVEKLPLPSSSTLKNHAKDKKKFYSEVLIYV